MRITLKELLENYTYDMYMWDTSREDYDKQMSEYTDLDFNEDFYELAINFWVSYEEEHARNNWEPDYVAMTNAFIESIEDDYTWIHNWEEMDIDWYIN